jgi:hypothetical protein
MIKLHAYLQRENKAIEVSVGVFFLFFNKIFSLLHHVFLTSIQPSSILIQKGMFRKKSNPTIP